ncbi:MAG: DcrB-related protein [Myxococcaceae bacterium]
MLTVNGFALDPPPEFKAEEMTVGLRHENSSLIVQSKNARAGAKLDELAGETMAELSQSIGGMRNLARSEVTFADGGPGVVLSYDWTTHAGELRQYFVMRLDNGKLCTVTLTVPRANVTPESAGRLMQTISSIRPA